MKQNEKRQLPCGLSQHVSVGNRSPRSSKELGGDMDSGVVRAGAECSAHGLGGLLCGAHYRQADAGGH